MGAASWPGWGRSNEAAARAVAVAAAAAIHASWALKDVFNGAADRVIVNNGLLKLEEVSAAARTPAATAAVAAVAAVAGPGAAAAAAAAAAVASRPCCFHLDCCRC
eukprot:349855-Chlamydomonas_euryale.AAC.3